MIVTAASDHRRTTPRGLATVAVTGLRAAERCLKPLCQGGCCADSRAIFYLAFHTEHICCEVRRRIQVRGQVGQLSPSVKVSTQPF
jgi:hypothetical protein